MKYYFLLFGVTFVNRFYKCVCVNLRARDGMRGSLCVCLIVCFVITLTVLTHFEYTRTTIGGQRLVCVFFVCECMWMIYVLIRFSGILTNVEGKLLHF